MLLNKLTITRNPEQSSEEQPIAQILIGINASLEQMSQSFENELSDKQIQLEKKDQEIRRLQMAFKQNALQISELYAEIDALKRNNEGLRQINVKLLEDLSRKQQDIEWYKRTYENRSLLGTLKEKIFGKSF